MLARLGSSRLSQATNRKAHRSKGEARTISSSAPSTSGLKTSTKAALDAVSERSRAKGVWRCGAAIGDDAYVAFKLKELEVELCGSGTDADNF